MKIEKISENKLKILLTNDDLKQRDIKMTELAFGTAKTRELFKEMMSIATDEYDFDADDSQLMIEAIPISLEAIVIIVTKMDENEKIKLDKKPKSKKSSVKRDFSDRSIFIFEFNSLDDVTSVSKSLYGRFTGESYLFKMQKKFLLLLQNNSNIDDISEKDLEVIVGEYGRKRSVNPLSRSYLFEHGELVLDNPAVDVLGEYL